MQEETWNRERVTELRYVPRSVRIALNRRAANERVAAERNSYGDLAERRLMPIAFADLAKLVVVALLHERNACAQQQAVPNQRLADRTNIPTPRIQCFDISVSRWHDTARYGSTVAILSSKTCRREERATVAPVPEDAGSHHDTRVP